MLNIVTFSAKKAVENVRFSVEKRTETSSSQADFVEKIVSLHRLWIDLAMIHKFSTSLRIGKRLKGERSPFYPQFPHPLLLLLQENFVSKNLLESLP